MTDHDAYSTYTYQTARSPVWSTYRYWVTVYCDGVRIATGYADTLWGARRAARSLKRKHLKRPGLLIEEGGVS